MFIVNPNKDHNIVDSYMSKTDSQKIKMYPQFFLGIKFDEFRHIKNVNLDFIHPITVLSGSNKSGKTSVLLSIACSHYNFQRRNVNNGILERNTWGNVMKFVAQDVQKTDWTYYISYREGEKIQLGKKGQRKCATKKWNGVAKRNGQIGRPEKNSNKVGRYVCMIDLERIVPARHLSNTAYVKAQKAPLNSSKNLIQEYLSYIFECKYSVNRIMSAADKDLYAYTVSSKYSSYNTASGEDAITRIVQDIVDAPKGALILIEEIEIGLHPKIQRRLMDVLYHESAQNSKQFIVTTHSPTVLSSVKPESRIFIENLNGVQKAYPCISVNAAFTKMDSENYPLLNLYVEDDLSKKMVKKAIAELEIESRGFSKLIKVVVAGSAEHIYPFFLMKKRLYDAETINSGFACVLDGDKRSYGEDELLFYHYSNDSPEKMLVKEYLSSHPNDTMEFHLESSDNHCLLKKMCEISLASSEDEAFQICWECLMNTEAGREYFSELKTFLLNACNHFSANL